MQRARREEEATTGTLQGEGGKKRSKKKETVGKLGQLHRSDRRSTAHTAGHSEERSEGPVVSRAAVLAAVPRKRNRTWARTTQCPKEHSGHRIVVPATARQTRAARQPPRQAGQAPASLGLPKRSALIQHR